ncbi:hypothetical protein IWW50_002470 [Coemansia erecta]|nr:hypothetical protein IWW50_002470 [Coemansia erecta]
MNTPTSRLLQAYIVALLAFTIGAHSACISLKDSQGCPGFSQEFISTNATTRFSWYPKDDIAAFDKALSDYVVGQSNIDEFQSVFRCSGLDDLGGFSTDHGQSVIRYHRSMICADVIFSDENIQECYGDKAGSHRRRDVDKSPELQLAEVLAETVVNVRPTMPAPLCRTTCEAWLGSLHTIVANTTLCQPNKGNNREASFDSLRRKCDIAMYNGSSDRCVSGDANELKTCGYQRVEDWCKYCDYASDYADVCSSVGVEISDTGSKDKGKASTPTSTSDFGPDGSGLAAELKKQKRQERVFRVVAIVLSIAVGVCVIALIALISMGHRLTSASAYGHYPNGSASESGKDDSTLLHLGGEGYAQPEKAADFVDCFLAAVGKPRQVVRPFFARRDDEISLQNGDVVTLQMAFDDGWVVGKNLTSGGEGTFPLMCVMESLPASLPAQWSVLPESKRISAEQLRNSSRSSIANEHRALAENGGRSDANLFSRAHNHAGNADAIAAVASPGHLQSTRASFTNNRQPDGNPAEDNGQSKGKGILDRIVEAFSPSDSASPSAAAANSDDAGFFRRLVTSPFGNKDKTRDGDQSKPKGRPHSFNVHHVVHVGLTNPNYPNNGDAPMSPSTVPSTMRSENRYPVMPTQNSLGYSSTGRHDANAQPQPPTDPRNPGMGYGEFRPSNSSQPTTNGNDSMETYRTAEQSANNSSRALLAVAPAYLR